MTRMSLGSRPLNRLGVSAQLAALLVADRHACRGTESCAGPQADAQCPDTDHLADRRHVEFDLQPRLLPNTVIIDPANLEPLILAQRSAV